MRPAARFGACPGRFPARARTNKYVVCSSGRPVSIFAFFKLVKTYGDCVNVRMREVIPTTRARRFMISTVSPTRETPSFWEYNSSTMMPLATLRSSAEPSMKFQGRRAGWTGSMPTTMTLSVPPSGRFQSANRTTRLSTESTPCIPRARYFCRSSICPAWSTSFAPRGTIHKSAWAWSTRLEDVVANPMSSPDCTIMRSTANPTPMTAMARRT